MMIPSVIETSARGERAFDIYSLLLRERIIFLGTPIDDQVANVIIAQLLYLEREDPEKDMNLYIHSPGGSVTAGLAIYDTMQLVRPDIATYCVGATHSMGTVLLTAGDEGQAARDAERDDPHAPGAAGRRRDQRAGVGHRDPGEGDHPRERTSARGSSPATAGRRSRRSRRTSTATST